MNVKVVDNKPYFATHLIKYNDKEMPIYNEIELNNTTRQFDNESIIYSIEPLSWDVSIIDKVSNMKFGSRTELIKFITEDTIPEGEKLNKLNNENKELKKQILQQQDIIDYFIRPQDYVV